MSATRASASDPTPSAADRARTTVITWAAYVGLIAIAFTVTGRLGDGLIELFAIAFGSAFWLLFMGIPAALIAEALAGDGHRSFVTPLAIGLAVGTLTGVATLTMPVSDLFARDALLANIGLVVLSAGLMAAAQLLAWRTGRGPATGQAR